MGSVLEPQTLFPKPKQDTVWALRLESCFLNQLLELMSKRLNPKPFEVVWGDPLKGTILNPTYGSLKRDLLGRVPIPKGPPNPNS